MYRYNKAERYYHFQKNPLHLNLKQQLLLPINQYHNIKQEYTALKNDVDANKETFYSIWEQLAEHYKNYPNRVIFELLNEPNKTSATTSITAATLNTIQLAVVDKIRAIDPDRMIALAVYGNNVAGQLCELTLPADTNNLIVSVHDYSNMDFTHQGLDSYAVGVDYTASGSKAGFENAINVSKVWSEANNVPVWISEFGVYLGGLGQNSAFTEDDVTAYYNDFTTACNNSGIGWCVWEFNNGFGIFSDNQLKNYVSAGLQLN